MTALLWTVGSLGFVAEIVAIVVLILRDGETPKTREAADWARIKGMFATARDDLTAPVQAPDDFPEPPPVHSGDLVPDDVEVIKVARIAESMEPEGSPWRVSPDSAIGISQVARALDARWGPYRPRHRRDDASEITQAWELLIGTEYGDDATEAIEVKAA